MRPKTGVSLEKALSVVPMVKGDYAPCQLWFAEDGGYCVCAMYLQGEKQKVPGFIEGLPIFVREMTLAERDLAEANFAGIYNALHRGEVSLPGSQKHSIWRIEQGADGAFVYRRNRTGF